MIPKKSLNREFEYLKNKIEDYKGWKETLCKIAIFSYSVKEFKSMHQGKHVEECLITLLDATAYDNDGVETHTYYGNCDFYLHKLPISLKSSIKKDGGWGTKGEYRQNFCKIFDTSRKIKFGEDKKIIEDWRDVLISMLRKVGWEIPILAFTYDIKLNRGVLFLTSLSEIAENKFDCKADIDSNSFKSKIVDCFKFNGSSHYFISLQDAYLSASKNKRVIEFNMSAEKTEKYIEKKRKTAKSILDEIN
jgi:hypothetical protein